MSEANSDDNFHDTEKQHKVKAGKDGEPATVSIRVVNQGGETMKFRIKRSSQITRLLNAYCERKNVRRKELRFLFDGRQIIDEDATPDSLDMEEDDIIEVFAEQLGGTAMAS